MPDESAYEAETLRRAARAAERNRTACACRAAEAGRLGYALARRTAIDLAAHFASVAGILSAAADCARDQAREEPTSMTRAGGESP